MTNGYPFFLWIPGIPITDKDDETQSEEYEISSAHKDKHDDDITKNGEYEEIIQEDTYEDKQPSDRGGDPSNDIIKNLDQNDQEDATIENYGPKQMIEDDDMEKPEEI